MDLGIKMGVFVDRLIIYFQVQYYLTFFFCKLLIYLFVYVFNSKIEEYSNLDFVYQKNR